MHRHDINDEIWEKIDVNLPGSVGHTGRNGVDNRCVLDFEDCSMLTGASWRDLPKKYGDWENTHRRFTRWRDRGIWDKILKSETDEPDLSNIMIDTTYVKSHMHASGARGGNQGMAVSKGD